MKRELLQKLYDRLFPTAEAIIKRGQQHQRIFQTFKLRGGELVPHGIALLQSPDKDAVGMFIKLAARACPPDGCCVLIDEIWFKRLKPGEKPNYDLPVVAQGGIEMVVFHFFGRDWELSAYCKIGRGPNRLEKGEFVEGDTEGRMAPHSP